MKTFYNLIVICAVLVCLMSLSMIVRADDEKPLITEKLIKMKKADWSRVRETSKFKSETAVDMPDNLTLDILLSENKSPFGTSIKRLIEVDSTVSLQNALLDAQSGDFIYLQPGIYQGTFDITVSGTQNDPIVLYGSRDAIIQGQSRATDYGIHLTADYWILAGFSIQNTSKGIVADDADYNIIQGLEISFMGDEGIHLRSFSTYNLIKHNWIHDTGLNQPDFGEGVYLGSAQSNWSRYTDGRPDASDFNQVISNLIGPNITAEGIDIKEGTTGGQIINNTFIGENPMVVDSWIDVKGNDYIVQHNVGSHHADSGLIKPIDVLSILPEWGNNNTIQNNNFITVKDTAFQKPLLGTDKATSSLNLVVRGRELPYTLSELIIRFPSIFEQLDKDTYLLKAHLVLRDDVYQTIGLYDVHTLYMLVSDEQFTSLVSYSSNLFIEGNANQRITFQSWETSTQAPVKSIDNGRPYIFAVGGYMNINYGAFYDLGFEEGSVSGVAWKGEKLDDSIDFSRGNSYNSIYSGNYFGAYTFEAVEMEWKWNIFHHNISYGFDPHDFSNDFIVEENEAYENGSHGIIFSRGCDRNIIRNNISYNNDGHGIMIDDGKVLFITPLPRYQDPVPSNYTIIENNHVWDNLDGIVIEGGTGTIIRNNVIDGVHRYGIRLKDNVTETEITKNIIKGSERYNIFIYNNSDRNYIRENYIQGTKAGIGLQSVNENIIENNDIYILGFAIRMKGEIYETIIHNNTIRGRGSRAIDTRQSPTVRPDTYIDLNDFKNWRTPPPFISTLVGYTALGVWVSLILAPFVMRGLMTLFSRWTGVPAVRYLHMNQ